MNESEPLAHSAIIASESWETAVTGMLPRMRQRPVDIALLFAGGDYAAHFPALVRTVHRETGARMLLGCSGQGMVGSGIEKPGNAHSSAPWFNNKKKNKHILSIWTGEESTKDDACYQKRAATSDQNDFFIQASL
jgi:hypothetical protein